jgi:hypothetical protein
MTRTLGREVISTRQDKLARLAQLEPKLELTTLAHHIDEVWLREAYRRTRKDGAAGVDGGDMPDMASGALTPEALRITARTLDLMRPQGGATALQGMQLAEAIQHGKVIGFGSTKRAKDQEIGERLKRALGHRYTPDGHPIFLKKSLCALVMARQARMRNDRLRIKQTARTTGNPVWAHSSIHSGYADARWVLGAYYSVCNAL